MSNRVGGVNEGENRGMGRGKGRGQVGLGRASHVMDDKGKQETFVYLYHDTYLL